MKITILTIGSRGDVQPYLALGVGLQQAGHTVKLTTHELFRDFVTSYGLGFFPIGVNLQAIIQGSGHDLVESTNPFQALNRLRQALDPVMAECLEQSWQACQDADLVISTGTAFWGDDIAVKLGRGSVFALLYPMVFTQEILSPLMPPSLRLEPGFNGLSHQVINRFYWQIYRASINRWRQNTLGEAPLGGCPFFGDRWKTQLKLFGYSSQVVPFPKDWDQTCQVTGYWFLDSPRDFAPPPGLMDFLADGDPPVSIGFGSMASRSLETTLEIALAALKKEGQRGILLTGWSGVSDPDLPDSVFKLESVPHDWLFPQMGAIVHHGGAGTTAAALRSGVPSVVVPFFADQPFWGDRARQLKVSPTPIPRKQLSVDHLATAIHRAIADRALRQRAGQLGARLRAEGGVAAAVAAIEASFG
jgi:sterol 3beta-glucosyltransferase